MLKTFGYDDGEGANHLNPTLALATEHDRLDIMRKLLETGADPNACGCLAVAIDHNLPDAAALLLDAGAAIKVGELEWVRFSNVCYKGWDALQQAVERAPTPPETILPMVRLLLRWGADPAAKVEDGWSALRIAAQKNQAPEVLNLLRKTVWRRAGGGGGGRRGGCRGER